MNNDQLIEHALGALQAAYDYLEDMSYDDSDLSHCRDKIQHCYDILNSRNNEEQ